MSTLELYQEQNLEAGLTKLDENRELIATMISCISYINFSKKYFEKEKNDLIEGMIEDLRALQLRIFYLESQGQNTQEDREYLILKKSLRAKFNAIKSKIASMASLEDLIHAIEVFIQEIEEESDKIRVSLKGALRSENFNKNYLWSEAA